MKRFLFILLFIISVFSINAYADDINVSVDGKNVVFTDVKPQIINSRTMVPLRSVAEALGADVSWNGNTEEITVNKGDIIAIMQLKSNVIKINGFSRAMDCTPVIFNSRTLIPARYAAESLGYSVGWNNSSRTVTITKGSFVQLHFVDVGQGDCTIIVDNGHCMVIDAGEEGNESVVTNYIKSLGISTIDYIIATHPHSDHIGGLDGVINSFNVNNIIMPNVASSSHSFENLVSAIESSSANVIEPNVGAEYKLGNSSFTVLGPVKYDDDLNNDSVVIKLSYGYNSALFTGDCESSEENDIISTGSNISADILKVGHHGSSSSTSSNFLNKIDPKIAVICVGAGNSYGHPTDKTLSTLSGKTIYRTDLNGNIIVTMTGSDYFAMTAKTAASNSSVHSSNNTAVVDISAASGTYILNDNTKKVHLPGCSAVSRMSDKNKQSYSGSVSDLTARGYTACGICKPF